ncbi:MAG TPA: ISAs1 family transposase [Terriglobales bacterium]|nr:ISAs1 family transposase [Terriglobales bacterium]
MDQAADGGANTVPLDGIVVRPVRCEERARWRHLMRTHHYLGLRSIVGQSLWYVALFQEQWLALLGWGAAALKCAPRDAWIGWSPALHWRRLHLIANNARFLVLPEGRRPNVASRILALNTQRLSQDWERYYGHPILLGETFVDAPRFRGTCYLAAGWLPLGQTLGFAKRGRGYVAHGRPKRVLVRPLCPEARQRLLASFLPPSHSSRKENPFMLDVNGLPLEGEGGLIELLRTVVDPRKPRGVRHPVVTVVAIAVCAALSGARGFNAIAEWAKDLSRDTLRRLGSWRWTPPSEPTIRRVLQKLDADSLDAQLGPWLLQHGARDGPAVSVDGKTLRRAHDAGTKPPHLLSALLHQEGIVVAQREVGEKTNEIPELPRLLEPLPLDGAVVTADAMHTQEGTARYLVEEKKADYLFTVKDNQPTLKQDIADLHLESFPPSAHHPR